MHPTPVPTWKRSRCGGTSSPASVESTSNGAVLGMVGRRLGCKTVLADSDLPLVQQQLLASFEATGAAATEASRLLATNPTIDGTGLAGAISTLLKTQQTLFEVIQQLLQS